MSDAQDDPLLGLLTDIAEGVASLAARVDAMEVSNAAHQAQVNEALATIAEIATRTYYFSKPSDPLPDDIINTSVMDAMIERWPQGAAIGMSNHDRKLMSQLADHSIENIDRMIGLAEANPDQTNGARLRTIFYLAQLNREKNRRAKEQGADRGGQGRGR